MNTTAGLAARTAVRGPWAHLECALTGDLVLPGDDRYAYARQLQQMEFDRIRPLAVAYCASTQDVRTCLRFAQDHGMPVRLRSGGHSHNGWSTGQALILDVSRLDRIAVEADTVRLGAGARSVDVLDTLGRLGRQVITGTFPTVAAGGFLTGGGLGWQTRRYGVACDRVVSAGVVLADGRQVRCSAQEEPDLFWALRGGGGGNFGVVTDFVVRPIDAPVVSRYDTTWHIDAAARLLTAWQQWCAEGPDELGSSLVVLPRFGPDGAETVRIWGIFHGPHEALLRCLAELTERAGTSPVTTEVAEPSAYAAAMHAGLCGSASVAECHRVGSGPQARGHRHPYTLRTYRLTGAPMTAEQARSAISAWQPGLGQERYLLFIALGGAANRVARDAGAYVHRDAGFLVGYQYAMRDPRPGAGRLAAAWEWTERTGAVLDALAVGSYVNFPSTLPEPDWPSAFYGANLGRLLEVKRRYDPDNVFRHEQSLEPVPAGEPA